MTSSIQGLRLEGAKILRAGDLVRGDISVQGGRLTDGVAGMPFAAVDLSGYLVLPGIIDLHGDSFERQIAPRPTAPFPVASALVSVDREAGANGITTAWMAQSWSYEGGARGPDFAENFMAEVDRYRPQAMTDLRIQIRCETYTVDTFDRLVAAVKAHRIDYVIFNNHLDETLEMVNSDPEGLAVSARRAGRDLAAQIRMLEEAKARKPAVPRYLCNLATAFDELGVRYGSHDDPDAATRDYYTMIGARVCEFPTRTSPAHVARSNGDPILMGAPNVVRGGSQSGNISAESLIRAGLCDALVSDYHYPALAMAAHALADRGVLPFGRAWEMVSTNPAAIMGLSDRGVVEAGRRADLVVMNAETRQIEGTMVAGRWSFLCGGLAQRLSLGAVHVPQTAHAAE
jgi:alpha-D-ribose 1-methylphosphonate 5-triphosphate diphosphatase